MKKIALACLAICPLLCAVEKKAVVPANAPKPVGPYTPGILAGDFLYVSGQGARDADGKFADDARNVIVLGLDKPVEPGSKVS